MYFYTNTSFSQLLSTVTVVDAPVLAETLSSDGTHTAFAVQNSATNALPDALLTKLLDPVWKPQLQDVSISSKQEISSSITLSSRSHVTFSLIHIFVCFGQLLLYHVFGLEVCLTVISDKLTSTTLKGEEITIITDPIPRIGNSIILGYAGRGDIDGNNGDSWY